MLLLHGFGGCGDSWRRQIEPFSEHYRVVVPDLREHGRTNNPRGWSAGTFFWPEDLKTSNGGLTVDGLAAEVFGSPRADGTPSPDFLEFASAHASQEDHWRALARDRDPTIPVERAARFRILLTNAELCVLPNTGHSPPEEQPGLFNPTVLDFPERHYPRVQT